MTTFHVTFCTLTTVSHFHSILILYKQGVLYFILLLLVLLNAVIFPIFQEATVILPIFYRDFLQPYRLLKHSPAPQPTILRNSSKSVVFFLDYLAILFSQWLKIIAVIHIAKIPSNIQLKQEIYIRSVYNTICKVVTEFTI